MTTSASAASTAEPIDQADADQEIITQVLAGSKDAFGVLIQRYSDPLYRHALCMTGSPDVAEDILQLSFIKAYQHLAEVRGRFDAWVFRIVANGCKDWLKNIRRSHLSYDEDDQPSSYATPDEELDRTDVTPVRAEWDELIAEMHADGSSTITKHAGTDGLVSVGTVTAQLLYEIGGARYAGPDVTARFDTIELAQDGPDRVRIERAAPTIDDRLALVQDFLGALA